MKSRKINISGILALILAGIAIGCGVLIDPYAGAVAACVIIIILLSFMRPWVVVALLLAFTPFRILWWGADGIAAAEALYSCTFLLLVACWIVRHISDAAVRGYVPDVRSPLVPPLILLFAASFLSAFIAISQHRPFHAWGSHLNLISFYAMYFVVVGYLKSLKDLNKVFIILFVVTLAAVIRGIFVRVIIDPYSVEILGASVPKIAMASSAALVLLMLILPLSMLGETGKIRIFYGLITAFLLAQQILAFVRSRWIGAVAGLMFLFFALSPVKKKLFLKCALLILFIVIIYVQVCSMFPSGHFFFQLPRLAEERFASIFRPSEEITALTRFSEWSAALAKIKQHPIIGNGLGTKVSFIAYDEYRNPVRVSNYLHNSYLFFLLNTGIAGLLAILWLSIAFILYGLKVYRRTAKPYYKALALGCVTAYVSLFTTSFIGPELSFPGRTIVVGFLMGAVALIDKTGSNKPI